MNINKMFENYVSELIDDYTKTGDMNLILVTIDKDLNFRYNVANEYIYLLEFFFYYEDNLTPQQILNIELDGQNRQIGAIYKRNDKSFELITKKGF